jgi:hypothetical protein
MRRQEARSFFVQSSRRKSTRKMVRAGSIGMGFMITRLQERLFRSLVRLPR